MALTKDAASAHATSTRRLAINQPFPSPWDPAGRRIGGTVADKARQKTEPDMYAVDRAVCELLRRTRIIQNESSNASELLACFNDLAGLVGWEPRADPRDALRLADLCKQLATLIRSGSWAIWFGRDSNQLPLKSDPTWQEGTSAAEVGYTYVGLRACGAVGWGAQALDGALCRIIDTQLPVPAAFCTSLIDDLSEGVRVERQRKLNQLVQDIGQLTSPAPVLSRPRPTPKIQNRRSNWSID